MWSYADRFFFMPYYPDEKVDRATANLGLRIREKQVADVEDLDFQRKLIHIRHSVFAGTLGTPKSEASMASLPMPLGLEVRLKVFLASKHYRQNSQGLLFTNRRGRPFSANKLREKKLRPLLLSLGIPLAGFHRFDMVSLRRLLTKARASPRSAHSCDTAIQESRLSCMRTSFLNCNETLLRASPAHSVQANC